jgi:L-amino acid N-acyltransferase YncA
VSHKEILINHPGDGDWVMLRVGGVFNDKTDHVVGMHRDGRMVGGLVYTGYLGASIMMHAAGSEDNWVTKDFLWMIFYYAFVQLGVRKVMGLVASSNSRALSVDIRLGFSVAARIPDVYPDGADLIVLTMTRAQCRWLKITPRHYRSGQQTVDRWADR